MFKKLLTFNFSVLFVLSACAPSTPTLTSTDTFTVTPTSTATSTLTATSTPTATITPTATPIPVQHQRGKFSASDSGAYYFDPSLRSEKGIWSGEGEFYVCSRYFSQIYDSFEIAETNVDCINRNTLGWVSTKSVILGADYAGEIVSVLPEAKQCEDGIDNDRDEKIDYPSDPDCDNASDDWEDAAPPIIPLPPLPPPENERVRITSPSNGFELHCPTGDTCSVGVSVNWTDPAAGRQICVFIQPLQTENQPYYSQFTGTGGQAWIGPAPNNTNFKIIAVSTTSGCIGGSNLPNGNSHSVTIKRVN